MNTARFFKYVWTFFNIIHEKDNPFRTNTFLISTLSKLNFTVVKFKVKCKGNVSETTEIKNIYATGSGVCKEGRREIKQI